MLYFYDLRTSHYPTYLNSFDGLGGECAGITDYNGMYLVAVYHNRSNIRFYLFDSNFVKVGEKNWPTANLKNQNNQTISWPDSNNKKNYEAISLIKEQASNTATPSYYMIMYYNKTNGLGVSIYNSIDVFSISDLTANLSTDLNIKMIDRIEVTRSTTNKNGFRYSGGLHIVGPNYIEFFSTQGLVKNSTLIDRYR